MDTNPQYWRPGSVTRQPHWRWLRANYLMQTKASIDPRIDDVWVVLALRAVQHPTIASSGTDGLHAARRLWSGHDGEVRGELEARLLTSVPLTHIAETCRLTVALVEAYAAVFFDVRPMAAAIDWIMSRVIRLRSLDPCRNVHQVWKYVAVFGGPIALDVVIAVCRDRPLPVGVVSCGPRRTFEEAHLRLLIRLWVALHLADSDEVFARIVAAYDRLRHVKAAANGVASPKVDPLGVMAEFLATVGTTDRVGTPPLRPVSGRSYPPQQQNGGRLVRPQ